VGVTTLEVLFVGGAPRVLSRDFQGENLRSSLQWFNIGFGNAVFLHDKNLRSLIRQQQRLCIVYFLEMLLLQNLFCSPHAAFGDG
jgi:hypothetical protein